MDFYLESSTTPDGAGLTWPKEYGGRSATFIEQVIFQQELGCLNLPMGCDVLGVIMTGPALMQWGTDEQKKRYLNPILAGDEIWCEGMSEPGAGSDLASIQCRAELKGDEFIVNGQKVWTTIAHRADFVQLFVRTDPAQAQGDERVAGRHEVPPASNIASISGFAS